MKWSYIQMPLIIQGPRQLRNDIDVFLELVIDELVEMFENGVKDVWDEYKKEYVMIKAAVLQTCCIKRTLSGSVTNILYKKAKKMQQGRCC
jgi:hypothetical protein